MKNKYKVINNFLKKEEFIKIKNLMTGVDFPWYLAKGINNPKDNYYQFVHIFYVDGKINSSCFSELYPFIKKLKIKSLLKIKANLIPKNNKIIEHGYHCDFDNLDNKTAVFYINKNNGYTKFKDNFVSKSEENKILIFNSKEEHTGTTCTNFDYRIVINFNYF
jgi:hypothetical protein